MIKAFINLPVNDLARSCKFFTDMGFTLNRNFMDDKGAAIVIGDNVHLMLLTRPFFSSFTKRGVADAEKENEVIVALEVESTARVDDLAKKAIAAGATEMEIFREGKWMYGRRIADVDGHIFELIHMDVAAMPKTAETTKETSPT